MGSGLIYAAIIVMWALYFIPRWLRRHEELSESRSVEKFDHAMRILSRREPTADQRYIVMPPKPVPAPVERPVVPARSSRSGGRSEVRASVPSAARPTRRRPPIAFRRRRVLAALVLLTLVVAVAMPFTRIPWWGPLVAVAVTLVDLVHLRLQQRRRRELTRTRHAVRKRLSSRLRRVDSADRLVQARQHLLADRRAAAEAARVEEQRAGRQTSRRAAEGSDGWQPTPVPLPTYVTKPIAPRVGRPIDLTRPGAWTDAQGRPAGASAQEEIFDQTSDASVAPASASGTAPSYNDYVEELDQILERRRAVND